MVHRQWKTLETVKITKRKVGSDLKPKIMNQTKKKLLLFAILGQSDKIGRVHLARKFKFYVIAIIFNLFWPEKHYSISQIWCNIP